MSWLDLSKKEIEAWKAAPGTTEFLAWLEEQRLHGLDAVWLAVRRNDSNGAAIAAGRLDFLLQLRSLINRDDPDEEEVHVEDEVDEAVRPSLRRRT